MGRERYAISLSVNRWESIDRSRDEALVERIVRTNEPVVRGYLGVKKPPPRGEDRVADGLVALHDNVMGASCERVERNDEVVTRARNLRARVTRLTEPLATPELERVSSRLRDCASFYEGAAARGPHLLVVIH